MSAVPRMGVPTDTGVALAHDVDADPRLEEPTTGVPRTFLDRVSAWWRGSAVGLWSVVILLAVYELLVVAVVNAPVASGPWLGFNLLAVLALLGRRRQPLAVVAVTGLASVMVDLWGVSGSLALVPLVAMYSLFVTAGVAERLLGPLIVAACWTLPLTVADSPYSWAARIVPYAFSVVAVITAAAISRSRTEALAHGDAQLAAQAAAQRLTVQRDAARHQARVAAELHDSVGHDLTAIIALSEGLAGASGDGELDDAIATINALAREGLANTRHAVDSLRPLPPVGDAAQPRSWDDLEGLLVTVRATGLGAALTETGQRPHDARTGAVVYRIAREALTNVMRHAEGATRVVLALDHAEAATRITLTNDATRTETDPEAARAPSPTRGHGLTHLTDMVREIGGSLEAGPTSTGWRLHAVVPHEETA
ncbi:sensor histidine kinase [Actinomyces sp. MRS3W]|uniref:sensor histidine kinase n=1 Tax=Actinomyces sp. MRS3W TaxID=2800796 RepID=UPI0028FD0EBC|nr:histidine kinase [Actinomyces sp. MRS3W]MDU0348483.1 histidine kinase [Actinomyces sp. MRS3W]